ncbi:hypothetical protein BH10ACT1_BH10ACT1_25650 [soil metagenome]
MRATLRTPRSRRAALAALAVAGLLAVTVPASAAAPAAAAPGKGASVLSERLQTLAQPAVQRRGATEQAKAVGLSASGAGSLRRLGGRLVVDVVAESPAALARAAQVADAEVVATLPDGVNASMALPASSLTELAAVPGIGSAKEVLTPEVRRQAAPAAPARTGSASVTPGCTTGVQSEGDSQLRAALARSTYGLDGAGVTVGVLSDSFANDGAAYARDIANGDLPGPGNPCGRTTPVQVLKDYAATEPASDEGRAMAQIVHDLAPEAKLLFATAFVSDLDFANQIRALRAAGADVIVDDIGYFNEPMYQDGPIAVAVDQVHDAGVAYFSAAGNGEYKVPSPSGGTAKSIGSYEAPSLREAACPAAITGSSCHDFDTGVGVVPYDQITLAGSTTLSLSMAWNEPLHGVSTDIDLFLLDTSGAQVAVSENNSIMNGDPTEYLEFHNPSASARTYRVYVARFGVSGTPRFKMIFQRGTLNSVQWNADSRPDDTDTFGPTAYGHSATAKMMSVAAVRYDTPGSVEHFSSRGPATYCWAPAVGSAPAAALPSCTTEQVDVAATDGVSTTFSSQSGLSPFLGTSAAAPHAAAVAALMLQRQPCRTNGQVYAAQRSTARQVGGEPEAAQGKGLIDAVAAVGALGSCGPYVAPAASVYVPITPCRIIDTRSNSGGPLRPGTQRSFQVSGSSPRFAAQGGRSGGCGVPAGATAVEASVSAVAPTGVGYFRAWPTGAAPPNATFLNYSTGKGTTNTGSIALAAAGVRDVTILNAGARSHYVVDLQGYYVDPVAFPLDPGSVYEAITPCRVVDTRAPSSSALGPNAQRGFQVGGTGSQFAAQGGKAGGCAIPEGATAVEASVTAVGPTATGFFRAWPTGVSAPNATFLNYSQGRSSTNTGSIALQVAGTENKDLTVENFSATADYVIDVQGYFIDSDVDPTGSLYRPISPCRVADTRSGSSTPFTPNAQRGLQVGGTGPQFATQGGKVDGCAIPEGATAVEASVTAVAPSAGGYFRAWPTGVGAPNATFLNYSRNQSTTNTGSLSLQLAGTGNKDLTAKNFGGTADYVVDVQGYFQPPA